MLGALLLENEFDKAAGLFRKQRSLPGKLSRSHFLAHSVPDELQAGNREVRYLPLPSYPNRQGLADKQKTSLLMTPAEIPTSKIGDFIY